MTMNASMIRREHPEVVVKALGRLVVETPFYSALLLSSPLIPASDNPAIATAATDGFSIYYNPTWIEQEGFTPKQVAFILCHEVEHMVRQHCGLTRRGARDHEVWNIAGDLTLNADLVDTLPKDWCPEGALYDPTFKGLTIEQAYERLMKERNGAKQTLGWDDLISSELSTEDQALVRGRIVQAASKAGRSGVPDHLRRLINEITEPTVDWRRVLAEFMQALARDDSSWNRRNRRGVYRGLVLPSRASGALGRVGLIIDVSGSVHAIIPSFVSEFVGLVETLAPQEVHAVFCDTDVADEVRGTVQDVQAWRNEGQVIYGGGTDLRCGFDALARDGQWPDVIVVLTDADTPWPDPVEVGAPVIVIRAGSGQVPDGFRVVNY